MLLAMTCGNQLSANNCRVRPKLTEDVLVSVYRVRQYDEPVSCLMMPQDEIARLVVARNKISSSPVANDFSIAIERGGVGNDPGIDTMGSKQEIRCYRYKMIASISWIRIPMERPISDL